MSNDRDCGCDEWQCICCIVCLNPEPCRCDEVISKSANVTKGVYGGTVTVTVGDGWTDTPAKTREKVGRYIREEASRVADELKRDRLRAAMAGVANVMAGVRMVMLGIQATLNGYGDDGTTHPAQWDRHLRACGFDRFTIDRFKVRASAEWSRRVREGVARIKPPGPVVRCQSEED